MKRGLFLTALGPGKSEVEMLVPGKGLCVTHTPWWGSQEQKGDKFASTTSFFYIRNLFPRKEF